MPEDLAQYLTQAASVLAIPIAPQQAQQFIHYAHALQEWNRTINLTAIEEVREVIVKHFIDSIVPLRFNLLPHHASILDVGPGAGFPSIPLKIMRPDLRITLLEPNSKKASFLHFLIGTFQLMDVRVVSQTLKEFAKARQGRLDWVVVRALSLETMGNELADVLNGGTTVLAYRSVGIKREDIPLGLGALSEWSYELPFGFGRRVLVALGLAAHVPRGTNRPT